MRDDNAALDAKKTYPFMKRKTHILKGDINMLFNKKAEVYTIVTDLEMNIMVQRFVEKHCINYGVIEVMCSGNSVTISFRSKEKRENIRTELRKAFEETCNIYMGEFVIQVKTK